MKRAALVLTLLSVACAASANGAMGLALEMFDYRTWAVYVIAMLAIEAWFIGRALQVPWGRTIVITLLANAITAYLCPCLLTPALHGSFVGSRLNPSPFGNAIALLTGSALVSGALEALAWRTVVTDRPTAPVFGRVMLVHLLEVPIALLILLSPQQPYKGLELVTDRTRRRELIETLRQIDVEADKPMPHAQTAEELIEHYSKAEDGREHDRRDIWRCLHPGVSPPRYHRAKAIAL